MYLLLNTIQILAIATTVCYAIRTNTKEAKPFCWKNDDGTTFNMLFSVELDSTHPDGTLIPIETDSESKKDDGCDFDISGDLYKAQYVLDIHYDPATTSDENKCGVVRSEDDNGKETYTWRIAFIETKKTAKLMYDDLDRIYTFTCNEDELTEVEKRIKITVDTPNRDKDLDVTKPDVTFLVYKQKVPTVDGGGDYELVTEPLPAGHWIKLELISTLPADFSLSLYPYGIFGYDTIASGTTDFAAFYRLFEMNGCTSTSASAIPWAPLPFERVDQKTNVDANGKWVIGTGKFHALKFESSDEMNFQTKFNFCFGNVDENGRCVESCDPLKRRKRSTDEDRTAQTSIRIIDGDERYHVRRSDMSTGEAASEIAGIIIAAVVVSVLTLLSVLLVVVVCCMRQRRGRQTERNYNNFSNPPSVVVPTEKKI